MDAGTVTKCNFAGDEAAGESWTDKIMANKADVPSKAKPAVLGEGAEEDEWVRQTLKLKKRFCPGDNLHVRGGIQLCS